MSVNVEETHEIHQNRNSSTNIVFVHMWKWKRVDGGGGGPQSTKWTKTNKTMLKSDKTQITEIGWQIESCLDVICNPLHNVLLLSDEHYIPFNTEVGFMQWIQSLSDSLRTHPVTCTLIQTHINLPPQVIWRNREYWTDEVRYALHHIYTYYAMQQIQSISSFAECFTF